MMRQATLPMHRTTASDMILIIGLLFAIAFTCVFCLVSAIRKKSRESYLFIGLHLLGIIAYLINWWLIDK